MRTKWIRRGVGIVWLSVAAVAWGTSSCSDWQRNGGEQCDGPDVDGLTCQNFCYDGGELNCSSDCTFDFSGCTYCGDNVAQAGELCDGTDPGSVRDLSGTALRPFTCQELGVTGGGTLRCNSTCDAWDYNGCTFCDDGIIDEASGEECERDNLNGHTCNRAGDHGGTPTCVQINGLCKINYRTCYQCGDGKTDPGEQCDDGNTTSGDGCSSTCQLECGDGIVGRFEECDDGNRRGGDGCSKQCFLESNLTYWGGMSGDTLNGVASTSTNDLDACGAVFGVARAKAGDLVKCTDGSAVCDYDPQPNQCGFQVSVCFSKPQRPINPTCLPQPIRSVSLTAQSFPPSANALTGTEREAFISMVTNILNRDGGQVTRTDTATSAMLGVTPDFTRGGQCGGVRITVPVGSQHTLAVRTVNGSTNRVDQDQLTFECD